MPTNKNALIRYRVLDNCFRNHGRMYFIDDLIEACEKVLLDLDPDSNGISRRQIFEDISFMESKEGWHIELEKLRDGKKVYYRYADPSFSINSMPLNQLEIEQLRSTIDILSQFKGMPQFEWMHELLPKLQQGIADKKQDQPVIDFDGNEYLVGIEHLEVLYSAIYQKQVLQIRYQPFESTQPFELIIHPYYLKQYNNRWFLFGYNPDKEIYTWNLPLDRIQQITPIRKPYKKNTKIDWKEYFEDIIGVTKPMDKKTESIVLQFFGITGKYIASKPLHGSQKAKWINANMLEVQLQVIPNYELERLILSYGETVKVVTPKRLAELVAGRHKKAFTQYAQSSSTP